MPMALFHLLRTLILQSLLVTIITSTETTIPLHERLLLCATTNFFLFFEVIDLQDYRNRHSTYVAYDEGLRNFRRRVPIMAFWDDHETINDSLVQYSCHYWC